MKYLKKISIIIMLMFKNIYLKNYSKNNETD